MQHTPLDEISDVLAVMPNIGITKLLKNTLSPLQVGAQSLSYNLPCLIPSRPSESESEAFVIELEIEVYAFKLHSNLDAL